MEFYDLPYIGNKSPKWLYNIFQRGSNHQPVMFNSYHIFCFISEDHFEGMLFRFMWLNHFSLCF